MSNSLIHSQLLMWWQSDRNIRQICTFMLNAAIEVKRVRTFNIIFFVIGWRFHVSFLRKTFRYHSIWIIKPSCEKKFCFKTSKYMYRVTDYFKYVCVCVCVVRWGRLLYMYRRLQQKSSWNDWRHLQRNESRNILKGQQVRILFLLSWPNN